MASRLDAWCLLPGLAQRRTRSVSSEGRALLTDTCHVPGPSMVLCMLQTRAPGEALSPQLHGKLPSAFCRVYSVA